jgi:choline dehydrogenase
MLQLTIYLHSQASRVIFDKDKNAIGVAVLSEGDEYTISARKEVILSAGVFHSPQLLMLSGEKYSMIF